MKKVSIKIALVALVIATGTMGVQAQMGRGTGNGTGTCINTSVLTDEQAAILDELCTSFQADMAILRADMIAATSLADKLAIRAEMTAMRDAHQAEVKALLDSWGVASAQIGSKIKTGKGKASISGSGAGTGVCTGIGTAVQGGKQIRNNK